MYYSLTEWSGLGTPPRFIGLNNYTTALSEPEAKQALKNTLLMGVSVTVVSTIVGLALAMALQRRSRSNYLLRLLWFLPAALPTIAAAYMWRFIYSPQGPLVELWRNVFPHAAVPGFIASPRAALWSIVVIVLWQTWGYAMVICIAGLEGIDRELLEAAVVDGANRFQRSWHIILPLLKPALAVSATVAMVDGLLVFAQVIGTTGGGPGYDTETLAIQIYKEAFNYAHFGYGMALGVILGMVILILAALVGFLFRTKNAKAASRREMRPDDSAEVSV